MSAPVIETAEARPYRFTGSVRWRGGAAIGADAEAAYRDEQADYDLYDTEVDW